MWVIKLKLDSSKQILGSLATKYQVSMTGYPLSYYKDKGAVYVIIAGIMFGEDKNKKELVRGLKNSKEVTNIEATKDFMMAVIKEPLFTEPVYNPKIIWTRPVIINKDGFHLWDLASFDREALSKVLKFAKKYFGAKLIKFKEEKISNISFTRVLPELTKNQKKALEIAINHGYYDYPKKIKMEKLAEMMEISYSTYQAHLKKAEGKILPNIYKEL